MEGKGKEYSDKDRIRRELTRGKYGAIFTPSSFPGLTANYATSKRIPLWMFGLLY